MAALKQQEKECRGDERSKIKKKIESAQTLVERLSHEENQMQKPKHEEVMKFLRENMAGFFNEITGKLDLSSLFFWNACLVPRILFSPQDALYSIKFLKILVSLKVPNLSLLKLFSHMLILLIPCLHCCTSNEAEGIGIFLVEWF